MGSLRIRFNSVNISPVVAKKTIPFEIGFQIGSLVTVIRRLAMRHGIKPINAIDLSLTNPCLSQLYPVKPGFEEHIL